MNRVSFEVAKALKEAGYPQGQEEYAYRSNGEMYIFESMFDHIPDYCCDAPFAMEVWLWLWREKKIYIGLEVESYPHDGMCVPSYIDAPYSDPEDAIEKAIELLSNKI